MAPNRPQENVLHSDLDAIDRLTRATPGAEPGVIGRDDSLYLIHSCLQGISPSDAINNLRAIREGDARYPDEESLAEAISTAIGKLDFPKECVTCYKLPDGSWITDTGRYIEPASPWTQELNAALDAQENEENT